MRTIGKLALAFGLAAVLTAPAKAQFGMRGMGPMAGFGVLMSPDGQKELKLSEEQITKVQNLGENMRESMRETFQSLQDVPQDQRQEKMQAMMREVSEKLQKEIKGILNEDQMKRYKEISLQAMGFAAFEQEEVAKKLELTDEQKKKIEDIQQSVMEQTRSAFQDAQGDREAMVQKMREIREGAKTKALAVLTDKQKETWKEMTGKEFTFEPFGGGRRRPNN